MPQRNAAVPIDQLLDIMKKLRDPDGGCPWDLEQDFSTIAPHTIEEAYEVAEAIAKGDMDELKDELGDLMFQVVFYAQMAKESGDFDFNDVIEAISEKMVRRHPHVFGSADIATAEAQTLAWEETKARERAAKTATSAKAPSALDGVAETLPALTRAVKLQKRAARVGFDWPSITPVFDKIVEELGELRTEIDDGGRKDRIAEEYGDLLFVLANLGRHLELDPETVLRDANRKFIRRFQKVEETIESKGKKIVESSLEEMDAIWNEIRIKDKINS
ncbi:nucleoside triphosphate pyrophosphohydrolase [Sneathiella chungangensis]|uniref:Nucleoside triphosphate pyrophosphohydrolase n=1 Tax=Sneathiella chungangensis TaxID=1418234 RepID=A0A845M9I5_9PROT|nr:nucleoside triphosphate pyrophosphohydrolase [Sneathiella chungangensis]MZR20935.1 nucleoside triphosphate pyrophosphohydrolase [Sneathiella chungangensis]